MAPTENPHTAILPRPTGAGAPERRAIPIATDAKGRVLAEARPTRWGQFILVEHEYEADLIRTRESDNVFASLMAADDAWWHDTSARRYAEQEDIAWEPWTSRADFAEAAE